MQKIGILRMTTIRKTIEIGVIVRSQMAKAGAS